MSIDDKSTVQCAAADKEVFAQASALLRWTLPEVMHLAAQCVSRVVEGEDSFEQRTQKMLDKLGPAPRPMSNRSRTPVALESHSSVTPIEAAS